MSALLEIAGLGITIGGRSLVRGVSLSVAPGEIVGLVGESGSGKSLTALATLGLLPANATADGSIRLDGEELTGADEARLQALRGQALGIVFQEPATALNPVMRIGDQVAETLICHGVPRADARARADETLTQAGLTANRVPRSRYPHELSGGQRQRVAIAIAIAMKPRLLVADEPTTALDVTTQAQIMALLKDLVRETGMGLLLISHDLALVAGAADRVAVMRHGEIVEHGTPEALLRSGTQPYTRMLVAASAAPPHPPQPEPPGSTLLEATGIVREHRLPRRALFAARPRFRAVDGVSLTIGAGESVALVGESGSGKSTLLRTLLALETPQSGIVRLDGKPFAANARHLRRRVQIVFQDPVGSFDPRWRVEHLVAEPLSLLTPRPDARERRRKVEAMLEQVGLAASDADLLPHEFSGGQRQRIAIARALIVDPALVVLDEATSALDVSVKAQILDLLAALSAGRRRAYLFATHDLAAVRRIAERVLVMQAGRIVEDGPVKRIFAAPEHPYTASLIAAAPTLDAVLARRFGAIQP